MAQITPIASLRTLRSVALTTERLAEAAAFYVEAWGLQVVEAEAGGVWLRGAGTEHHVVSLHTGEQGALAGLTFAVGDRRQVDAAARNLQALGIPMVSEPALRKVPGGGYGLQFADIEGRAIDIVAETDAVAPISADPSMPIAVTHAVLNTVDIDAAADFYCSVLGLRVSDWSEHQMVFLRCNAYHHCIAFNQASWTSLNHVAYEMPSIDAFMRGIGRLRHHDVVPAWGPGRHGPGNNTFAYVEDPSGLVCEYTSEVQQIDEATWLPRVWKRTPALSDLWGTAGAPSAAIRTAMSGQPDSGVFDVEPQLRTAMGRFSERYGLQGER